MNNPSTHASLLFAMQSLSRAKREEAWAVFEQRYRPLILAWSLKGSLPRDVAEDLTQEVLLKLSVKFLQHCYDPERGRFRSWLRVVVKHAVADFWRQRQRQVDVSSISSTSHWEIVAKLDNSQPCEELSDSIAKEPLTKALRALAVVQGRKSKLHWQVFLLYYDEKRSVGEIAAELGLQKSNVSKILQRIKHELDEEMKNV